MTDGGGFGGGRFFGVKLEWDAGVEGEAFALEFGRRMAVAVAADGAQTDGQDMAQVAGNKLHARNGFGSPGVTMGAVFPRKGDRRFADAKDAGVGDGCAANIGAQILDDTLAVAEGLEMHAPIFFPDGGFHTRQGRLFRALAQSMELLLKEMPECRTEHGLGHKEPGAFNPSFSWPTGDPHKTSGVVPKALQSLYAGISVFRVGKADFQSIPSIS